MNAWCQKWTSKGQGIKMIKLKSCNLLKNDSKKLRFASNSNERELDSGKKQGKHMENSKSNSRETHGTSKLRQLCVELMNASLKLRRQLAA